jgi:Fur family transcriptional regulator, ferric uptake regulator
MSSRTTRSQQSILHLLKQMDRAISAQDLYVELRNRDRSIGLATVYRGLEALKLRGVVQSRTVNNESLYSLVQSDTHYLTCLGCGTSIPLEDCPVSELEATLYQSLPFKIYYHTLEFFGMCLPCQLQLDSPIARE